jgi:hypothetical protein
LTERPHPVIGLNRRKTEDQHRDAAEKEAVRRRATEAQLLEDAERMVDSLPKLMS